MTRREEATPNAAQEVVEGFGDEWTRFDQSELEAAEARAMFDSYFGIFPWELLPPDSVGFDAGCGSGRWARLVAPRVGLLHCVDASEKALAVARQNLRDLPNCSFHHASVQEMPIADRSADFGYSLGVLHHIPDTESGLRACVAKLKPGAPFLLYLYYAFDNRPWWFRMIWKATEPVRFLVSRSPYPLRYALSQLVAALVYWPLARTAGLLGRTGMPVDALPLSAYRDRSFYVMRTDALDRFGTRLERRFTRAEMERAMRNAGLEQIRFSDHVPFWCAVGIRSGT